MWMCACVAPLEILINVLQDISSIHIALIWDKSVKTQNLAFLSYSCRKKCLQMHFEQL
jgi:hypothetical protein